MELKDRYSLMEFPGETVEVVHSLQMETYGSQKNMTLEPGEGLILLNMNAIWRDEEL